jgi:hypothetical protein
MPIFTTPGAGPIGNRVDAQPQLVSRLAPVSEFPSSVSTEAETTDGDIVVFRPRPEKVKQITGDDNAQKFVEAKAAQAALPWYNRPQYEEELKIEFDGTVKQGTLRALIEHLTGDFISKLSPSLYLELLLTHLQMLSKNGRSATSSSSHSGHSLLPMIFLTCSLRGTKCYLRTASALPRRMTGGPENYFPSKTAF